MQVGRQKQAPCQAPSGAPLRLCAAAVLGSLGVECVAFLRELMSCKLNLRRTRGQSPAARSAPGQGWPRKLMARLAILLLRETGVQQHHAMWGWGFGAQASVLQRGASLRVMRVCVQCLVCVCVCACVRCM